MAIRIVDNKGIADTEAELLASTQLDNINFYCIDTGNKFTSVNSTFTNGVILGVEDDVTVLSNILYYMINTGNAGQSITITLPNDLPEGVEFTFKRDESSLAVTYDVVFDLDGLTIDGDNSITVLLPTDRESIKLTRFNSNWNITDSTIVDFERKLQIINTYYDFPSPSSGVITLEDNVTYFITGIIDLTANRLVGGQNTTIIGGSSENCRIKSTGLNAATALISSAWSLPIRNITIEHGTAINLDATANANQALDWFGVNFTDCAIIGTIKNYNNFVMNDSAFLNSQGLTFDGSIDTIAFGNSLFDNRTSGTMLILPSTLTVTRRFRIIYSSFICLSGETGINVNASATIPEERYILDTVNFSGGGTYLTGVTDTSNKALFISCVGITNTNVNGQLYMQGNATVTTVASANVFYKVLGTTTASTDNQKYLHSNNRLTNDAIIPRKFLIQCNLSFNSTNANVCEFGFYDSVLATVRTPSKTKSTANASGRAENVSFNCVVTHKQNDYLEIWAANTTGANNITVTDLNFVITEIK